RVWALPGAATRGVRASLRPGRAVPSHLALALKRWRHVALPGTARPGRTGRLRPCSARPGGHPHNGPAGARPHARWQQRRSPAWPGDGWGCLGEGLAGAGLTWRRSRGADRSGDGGGHRQSRTCRWRYGQEHEGELRRVPRPRCQGCKSLGGCPQTCPCVPAFSPEPVTDQWSSSTCSVSCKLCPESSCASPKTCAVNPKTIQQPNNAAAPTQTAPAGDCETSGCKQEQ
ncbi:hypothetical protein Nmel_015170, partial [Mimus melanotis]